MILPLLLAALTSAAPPATADQTEALAARSNGVEAGRLWSTAGNIRLVAGDTAGAARDFDEALALPNLSAVDRGEASLDRARAAQAAGDLVTASARAADAARLIPQDPFLWYFRASLAVARDDVPQAKIAIARALALAPEDPTILFEAGHVAAMAGEDAAARNYWTKAVAIAPISPSGQAARNALAATDVPLKVSGRPVGAAR